MKVKMRNRKTKDMGMADCRCCSRLSWKEHIIDKQVLKEVLEETTEDWQSGYCSGLENRRV